MYLFLADIVISLSCLLFYFFFVLLSAFLVYIQTETISQNAAYLQRFVKGISICKKDERANNGECTEPHISHVLAARLSSRPLAWSETTLKHLAPILAAGKLTLNRKSTDNELVTLPLIHYLAFSKKFSYKNLTRTGEFRCLTFICRRDII